jgi:putative transposase
MSSKRYTQEQILKMLKEIDSGATIASVARTNGVNVQTLYQWRKRYAGMSSSKLAELKALQEENRRLKRIVASQALDIDAYKELQKGKW